MQAQSKIFIFPKRYFHNLPRETQCVEFFSVPIDSLGLYVKGQMDLGSIVTYLSMKDINAREISADRNDTLGADCIGY
jgi:ethanolamine utilization protein EutP (predicted NTPase)